MLRKLKADVIGLKKKLKQRKLPHTRGMGETSVKAVYL